MNQDVLQKLKDHYMGEYSPCKHTFTHPRGCDHCPAVFCYDCNRYHQKPVGSGCQFSRLLNDNVRDLIELAHGSQRAVQEFIDAHHNPIVSNANKTITHLEEKIGALEDRLISQVFAKDHFSKLEELLWTCPSCDFSFSAKHSNADGSYSCPNCNEAELMTDNYHLKEDGEAKSKLIQFLTWQLDEIMKREDRH